MGDHYFYLFLNGFIVVKYIKPNIDHFDHLEVYNSMA